MAHTAKNPDAGGVRARNSDQSGKAIASEKTKSAPENQGKSLPPKATLVRRWPGLKVNRFSGRWRDDATGARGDSIESLLTFLSEGAQ